MPDRLTRREMLTGTIGAAALALNATSTPAQDLPGTDTIHAPGRLPNALGTRAATEQPKRLPSPTSSRTPLQDLDGTITPSDLHYERHHAGVPVINPQTYQLLVHGMVDRPLTFTLADLRRFPQVSRLCFLECSGNLTLNGGEQTTAGALCGLTSQSEW